MWTNVRSGPRFPYHLLDRVSHAVPTLQDGPVHDLLPVSEGKGEREKGERGEGREEREGEGKREEGIG